MRPGEAQEFDRAWFGIAEPVRQVGVEFGDLAGGLDQILIAEDDAEATAQDVQPVVALVRARAGFAVVTFGRPGLFDGLQPTGSTREGDDGHASRVNGRGNTRGSPLAGAPTSSSGGTR